MNTAVYEGSGKQLKIEAPFVNMTKADVVKIGLELKVPYELTGAVMKAEINLAVNAEHVLTVQRHLN